MAVDDTFVKQSLYEEKGGVSSFQATCLKLLSHYFAAKHGKSILKIEIWMAVALHCKQGKSLTGGAAGPKISLDFCFLLLWAFPS